MIRAFVPDSADWSPDARVELPTDESHHLCSVLRAPVGAPLVLLDGAGRSAPAVLEAPHKKHAVVRISAPPVLAPRPAPRRILVQALVREQRMDSIVQKAVELGASEIWPVQTDFAVVRIRPEDAARKAERWQSIALAACKQSGNPWLPLILPPMPLPDALSRLAEIPAFYGALRPEARPLSEVLRTLCNPPPDAIAALIGPEGDFSPAEYDFLAQTPNLHPATFGPLVLRAETAAFFALSSLLLSSLS